MFVGLFSMKMAKPEPGNSQELFKNQHFIKRIRPPRGARANKSQLNKLVEYMCKHPELARGMKGFDTMWKEITEELNSLGSIKSVESWQITWRDLKSKACGRLCKLSRNKKKGLNLNEPPLSEQEKLICKAVGAHQSYNMDTATLSEEEELQQRLELWDGETINNELNPINEFEVVNFEDFPSLQLDATYDDQQVNVDETAKPEPDNKVNVGPIISKVTSLATGSSRTITNDRPILFQKKFNRNSQPPRIVKKKLISQQKQNDSMKLFAEAAMRQADAAKRQADAAMMQAEAAIKQADAGKELARAVVLQAENERRRLDYRTKYEGLLLTTLKKLTMVLERS